MIADRIRQARLAAGLTLGALGEKVGVSHTAIQKYEKGLLTPSSSQLLKLARACDIRTEYFFRTHSVELLEPEFRKTAAFGKTAQDALKIKVVELVEKRVELLGAFPKLPLLVFAPPVGLPEHIQALDEIEALADQARNAWQLGMNPIGDLTDTLEGLGLLVIVVDEEHPGFSGLTAKARTDDGREFPIVAVSKRWPGDRQRFTLAHELRGAGATQVDIAREVRFRELESRRTTIDDATQGRPVALAEGRDLKESAYGVTGHDVATARGSTQTLRRHRARTRAR